MPLASAETGASGRVGSAVVGVPAAAAAVGAVGALGGAPPPEAGADVTGAGGFALATRAINTAAEARTTNDDERRTGVLAASTLYKGRQGKK
jgi:hypothetical protein